jgi:hypothetical protein
VWCGVSSGFVEFMSPTFIRKWHKGIHKGTTKVEDLPTVQCVQMKKIMREINVKHVDIWILGERGGVMQLHCLSACRFALFASPPLYLTVRVTNN